MKVVYIDTVFLVNLAVDYLLLYATAGFAGMPYKKLRLLLASVFGAVYSVTVYYPALSLIHSFPFFIIISFLMLLIAFGNPTDSGFIKKAAIFLGISALIGGAIQAVYSALGSRIEAFENLPPWAGVPLLILSVALLCGLLGRFFGGAGIHGIEGRIVSVEATLNGKKTSFQALVDTGNALRDPITGSKVIVCEQEAVRDILSYKFRTHIGRPELSAPTLAMEKLASVGAPDKLRLIPYTALGKEGMLLAFSPDEVRLDGRAAKGIVLAIAPDTLSEGAGYCALI